MDTANKRSSAIMVGLPFRSVLPLPHDSPLDRDDFKHTALSYRFTIENQLFRYRRLGTHQAGSGSTGTHQAGSRKIGTHQAGASRTEAQT